ncbi:MULTISPECIES: DUF6901 family protein [Marinobacter]|uniref:DUF6901 family protein n=1 Tax=Marinobacter TaxID=2742 RepID=UPI0011082C21|nr:hypothetical protein [Marinobacter alexandrii]
MTEVPAMSAASVDYYFSFRDGARWEYRLSLDSEAVDMNYSPKAVEWARLEYHQCSHCPLADTGVTYCPYALALIEPARATSHRPSHEVIQLTVVTPAREIRAETTLQRAMGSLMGLIGPFSGCPVTAILRPMARHHLPLSTADETLVRALGMYLVGQYLRDQHGWSADWNMDGLRASYEDLRILNRGMSERLRAAQEEDAGVNSFVLLDILAADVGDVLQGYEGSLDDAFREFLR